MANIKIDTAKTLGKIKPMHAGGQPPITGGINFDQHMHYLTEAGIPYSRLHDVGGAYGMNRFVDIPNVFRDFDADENDPASYDFTFTDLLLKALVDAGVEPYYRLGITIENLASVKAYRTSPPKDYEKWARICEHIIMHYNEGWADGFHFNITYWEIWNEPDNNRVPSETWGGSMEDFFRLYDITARHLKKRFPNIKVGGYASSGFWALTKEVPEPLDKYLLVFFEKFLEFVSKNKTPIDFFSWHSYENTKNTLIWEEYMTNKFKQYGLENIENHLNEWDPYYLEFGTGHHAAEIAAMMLAMQNRSPSMLCIYDMRINTAPYATLFDVLRKKPIHGYYSMVAFNTLYKLKNQVELTSDTEDLYAVAASDGKRNALMISNLTGETQKLTLEGVDLENARVSVIDDKRLLSWAPNANEIENNAVMLIEW